MQLLGWSKKRRVVVVRQRIKGGIARERRVDGRQLKLDLVGASVHEGERLWDYAVLVTDVSYPIGAVAQLYRDRADCRICQVSGFDELKNQWGLIGFTTQDINRCQTRPGCARWSTTGGVGAAGRPTRRRVCRPSRAGRCHWPRWVGLQTAQARRRCTSRRCMERWPCSNR